MKLHHLGFIVKDIDIYQSKMIFEEKIADIVDPLQNARLCLYKNFSNSFIELIQPLNEKAFTWNSLQKNGDHFAHLCYVVANADEMESFADEHKLIQVLEPIPAELFNGKNVCFYYTRNRQIVEFIIDN
jgi:hypothetical protein